MWQNTMCDVEVDVAVYNKDCQCRIMHAKPKVRTHGDGVNMNIRMEHLADDYVDPDSIFDFWEAPHVKYAYIGIEQMQDVPIGTVDGVDRCDDDDDSRVVGANVVQ
jgi:hypothetical protein